MSRYLYLRFFSFFRNKTFWLLEIEMLEYRFYLAEIFGIKVWLCVAVASAEFSQICVHQVVNFASISPKNKWYWSLQDSWAQVAYTYLELALRE